MNRSHNELRLPRRLLARSRLAHLLEEALRVRLLLLLCLEEALLRLVALLVEDVVVRLPHLLLFAGALRLQHLLDTLLHEEAFLGGLGRRRESGLLLRGLGLFLGLTLARDLECQLHLSRGLGLLLGLAGGVAHHRVDGARERLELGSVQAAQVDAGLREEVDVPLAR